MTVAFDNCHSCRNSTSSLAKSLPSGVGRRSSMVLGCGPVVSGEIGPCDRITAGFLTALLPSLVPVRAAGPTRQPVHQHAWSAAHPAYPLARRLGPSGSSVEQTGARSDDGGQPSCGLPPPALRHHGPASVPEDFPPEGSSTGPPFLARGRRGRGPTARAWVAPGSRSPRPGGRSHV